jgi:MoaA/NifB/PqqE/SkfB family radical SAM enzyme
MFRIEKEVSEAVIDNFELLLRFAANLVRRRLLRRSFPKPLILSYFVTFRCNLHCGYCDYADGEFRGRFPELPTGDAIRVLEIARKGNPAVAFSGGEPLVREDIAEIVKAARRLRYRPIILFTNSLLLPMREEVLDYVDFLQISLDTVDESPGDGTRDHRVFAKTVKENIRRYAALQAKKSFRLNVNCVVCEDSIDDARGVLEFAKENDVRFTLCPRLTNEKPADALVGNSDYEDLIGYVMTEKRRGKAVLDTFSFLSHMRNFKPFSCVPWLTPRVYPNGDIHYPCHVLNLSTHNVLVEGSWRVLEKVIRQSHGTLPECRRSCFLPCYLEVSSLFTQPLGAAGELCGTLKGWDYIKGIRRGRLFNTPHNGTSRNKGGRE